MQPAALPPPCTQKGTRSPLAALGATGIGGGVGWRARDLGGVGPDAEARDGADGVGLAQCPGGTRYEVTFYCPA